jgi:preprotein translocase subunit YajC
MAVHVGAEVMTTAGIYGTVVWMEDQTIGLQISDGVVVKYARAAVASVMDGEG